MAFRIDDTGCKLGVRNWRIKGINGEGIYGSLVTGAEGQGLYLSDMGTLDEMLTAEQFSVSSTASPEEGSRKLSATLKRIGWGPEVNQIGEIIG
jgi:hypothetical protein